MDGGSTPPSSTKIVDYQLIRLKKSVQVTEILSLFSILFDSSETNSRTICNQIKRIENIQPTILLVMI